MASSQALTALKNATEALIAEYKAANPKSEEAFNEAMKDMTVLVGQKGVEALKQFGEDTKRLSDDWARFMTQMI